MSSTVKKMPVPTDDKATHPSLATEPWRPMEKLRQQVDHLFEEFNRGSALFPFGRGLLIRSQFGAAS